MSELDCRMLYRQAFCDPDTKFEDKLFKNCFSYCKTHEENGHTVSMLFALPCEICGENGKKSAVYIYAAATHSDYRGKGIMTGLIESVKSSADTVFLVPEKAELIPFYKKLGFCEFNIAGYRKNDKYVNLTGGFIPLSRGEREDGGYERRAMYYSRVKQNLDGMYFPYSMLV